MSFSLVFSFLRLFFTYEVFDQRQKLTKEFPSDIIIITSTLENGYFLENRSYSAEKLF